MLVIVPHEDHHRDVEERLSAVVDEIDATTLGFLGSGPPEPDVTVRADRPFLYLIRHTDTGAVLFIGRVMDPST